MKKYDPNQMKFVTGLLSVSILITAIGCAAQHPTHSFTELQKRLKRGNTIYVVDTNGTVTSGKFVEASDDALTLNVAGLRQQIDRAQVRQVDRYGDSVWNGLLIGAGVGASSAVLTDPGRGKKVNTGERALGVGLMGAIGAGIDAAISDRKTIYLGPTHQATNPALTFRRP